MSVLSEYAGMKVKIWNAIDSALLYGLQEEAKPIIETVMQRNVYDYPASPWAIAKRRKWDGGLGDAENSFVPTVIEVDDNTHELDMENFAGLQDYGPNFRGVHIGTGPSPAAGHYAARLDEIVETGDPAYRQPYPRPFYKDIETQLVKSGKASRQIRYELIWAGFEVG